MINTDLSPLMNHLWQSSLCAPVVWVLTFMLRKNRAAVRYSLWLAASVKFLIPFSLLVAIGGQLGWRTVPAVQQPQFVTVMTELSRPFAVSPHLSRLTITPPPATEIITILVGIWLFGILLGLLFWIRTLRQVRAVQSAATPLHLELPIPVISASARMEPSVFGIWKPVLLMPAGIVDRLTPAELEAVFEHELCHVRRMDNLTAAIHMAVETIFWFHPLVWWIRTQLVVERERACDEEVLKIVSDPQIYAEGILNVCRFCLESPLACISGVTGADLKKRIKAIMARRIAQKLDFPRKVLLALAGVAAVTTPIAIGLLNASPSRAQSQSLLAQPISYVASIKPNNAVDARAFSEYSPGGRLTATAVTVASLLRIAYRIQPYQLVGAPAWISTKRYDIAAKVDDNPAPPQQALLRVLLKDRFKLTVHDETRELPIFALVVSRSDRKLGPQLVRSAFDCAAYAASAHGRPEPGSTPNCATRIGPGTLYGKAIPMAQLATSLAPFAGRFTVDKTGLTGEFDVELTWTPDQVSPNIPSNTSPDAAADLSGPSIFGALQEQLGLKLISEKGAVTVLVIDHLEEPSAN